MGFNNTAKKLIENTAPGVKILIIADENLDIVEDGTHHRTLSGSLCIEQLRQDLSDNDEARVLAVVRSANDSSHDVATYQTRTHGFVRKAPIRKGCVQELIQPLWSKRFPVGKEDCGETNGSENSDLSVKENRVPFENRNESGDLSKDSHVAVTPVADLLQIVESLDGLLLSEELHPWPCVRDKFQVLKGDMMTMMNRESPRVSAVVEALEDLRALESAPADMRSRWKLVRALILTLV